MSWCYGGLSRTLSMVPVPPYQCLVTNAQRLPLQMAFVKRLQRLSIPTIGVSLWISYLNGPCQNTVLQKLYPIWIPKYLNTVNEKVPGQVLIENQNTRETA